ncbi:MAG: ferritin family protein [Pseudomonadota bacterium]
MLAQKGFREVYSLKGGIKAWDGLTAVGPLEQGLGLVTGREDRGQMLTIAYGLEAGLAAFYTALAPRAQDAAARGLCQELAGIEQKHQDTLWRLQAEGRAGGADRDEFARQAGAAVMEGGETVAEALDARLAAGFSQVELLGEALALEAQALDLYLRFSQKMREERAKAVLYDLAQEEKAHLIALGGLLDQVAQSGH